MNTRIYKNSYNEQSKESCQANGWGEPKHESVRGATPMERARSSAAGVSAVIVLIMLSVTIVFASIALANPKNKGEPPVQGPLDVPITFAVPVNGEFSITRYYADDRLQWNETAQQWQGFKAINMSAELGTAVVATYAGTITEVSSSAMYGTVVKITHKDGLMTVYSGLDPALDVKRGDYVEKGQRIGKFGDTLKLEAKDGPTLRIEVFKDGKKIGVSTSGTHSPYFGYPIAMGYIEKEHSGVGTKVVFDVRGREVEAEIVNSPFYKRK